MNLSKEISKDKNQKKNCCGNVCRLTWVLLLILTIPASLVVVYYLVTSLVPLIGRQYPSSTTSYSPLYQGQSCYLYGYQKCAQGLTCNPSTSVCECSHINYAKCLAKFGQNCDIHGLTAPPCDLNDSLHCSWSQCVCKNGTAYNNKIGKCQLQINEPCRRDHNDSTTLDQVSCDESKFLVCPKFSNSTNSNVSRCQCKSGMKLNIDGECRVPVGQNCNKIDLLCTGSSANDDRWYRDQYRNVFCSNKTGKCECKAGLTVTKLGDQCGIPFDGSCSTSKDFCDRSKFLRCDNVEGKCGCQYGTVRNEADGTCVLSSDANGNNRVYPYTPRASCSKDGSAPGCDSRKFLVCGLKNKTCQCRAGFVMTSGGCRALFGQECGGKEGILCDEENFLRCGNTTRCECREGLVGDGRGFCEAAVGSKGEGFYFNLIMKRMLKDRVEYLRNAGNNL